MVPSSINNLNCGGLTNFGTPMAAPLNKTPLEILRKYWGHSAFRPPQDQIIQTVLDGKDCLALLPTGGGKSVCFQVPALAMDGICLVVSPLIALMEDQIRQLKQRGIPCAVIHSGMSYSQLDTVLDNCVYGKVKLLYLSPERIQTELFIERMKRMKVSMVAVDEAHCISEWGYDFRPPYLKIGSIREVHPDIPIMALTASATGRVRKDIAEKLGLKKPEVISRSFARDNISFVVRQAENKDLQMAAILRKVEGSAIVYVRSRKATEELAGFLQRQGISGTWYHAGLSHEERTKRQASWISGQVRVMVATNAFGMGIDKADVRVVIHNGLPESLEAYYQEAGRAGRDGLRSYAVLLHFSYDDVELEKKVTDSQPDPEYLKHIYQCLANYYQLAEGAGLGHSVEFDLGDFAARYDLRPSLAYAALRRLEEQGLVALDERFHKPSRLHIHGDRSRLYEFQVAHERFDPVIHAVLRLYGAELFTEEVVISEAAIAQALRCKTSEAKELLQQLTKLQVMRYDEASDKPRITWLVPRQDAKRLPLDLKALAARKEIVIGKMKAMVHYANQTRDCRQQVMLRYFDEPDPKPCGRCDLCLDRLRKDRSAEAALIRQRILEKIASDALTIEALEADFPPEDHDLFMETIREMMDDGLLEFDERWMVRRRSEK